MIKLDPNNESDLDLVRRMACAFISHQMGVSYQTLWKNYDYSNKIPGEVWFEITEHTIETFRNGLDNSSGQ